MKFSQRVGGLSMVVLLGCGGATFTTEGDGGGTDAAQREDGAVGNDGSTGNDAGHSTDGADAGSPPDSGVEDSGNCVTAMIAFAIQVAPGSTKSYCVGGSAGTCSASWLSIRPATSSSVLTIDSPCVTTCSACQPFACAGGACAAPMQLPPSGAKRTWDGTYYAAGTCGANLSCVSASCASPGHYIARMCGNAKVGPDAAVGFCAGATTPTCVDVPFDWPPTGSAVVQGTLP